jgi:hypothetical protein
MMIHGTSLLLPKANVTLTSFQALQEVSDGRVIWHDLSPQYSPDVTPWDFCLWGSLKYKVYKTKPHILEEEATTSAVRLQQFLGKNSRVNNIVLHRYTVCIQSGGQQFQHLL